MLFAAIGLENRQLLHASVACCTNYLITRRFPSGIAELYGLPPPIVLTDGATNVPAFTRLDIKRIIRSRTVRNRIQIWIQELKRCIEMC